MNKRGIEKAISYVQNMDLSVFVDKDEACNVVDMITDLLQQQLTNGWIPISERLPEKREEVLLEVKLDGYYSIVIGSYCIVNGKWEIGNDVMGYDWEEDMIDEVIAWQPLPPKYKEVSE